MTATVTRRRSVRRASVAGALVVGLLLTGCATELPVPNPDDETTGPALAVEQNDRVLQAINAAVAAGTETLDAEELKARVTGPALAVRTSQLQVAGIRSAGDLITELPTTYQQIILPTSQTWPRTSFAITEPTDELQPPRMLALVQANPRSPYRLWGWVQLRPGIQMPSFAHATIGSEILAPDDESLLVSPQDAVAQYADVVTTGDGSAFAATFEPAADDPYRAVLASVAATQTAELAEHEGSFSFSVTPRPGTAVQAVRTADGGAVVMAALDGTEVMQAVEGSKLEPGTATAQALVAGQEPTHKLTGGFLDMIALYIPPAGSSDPVVLVGYSHVQVSAAFG